MRSIESIRTTIAKNDLAKAIEETHMYIKQHGLSEFTNHIIGLEANWNELEQHNKKGTLSFENISLYRNKIISGLNFWLDRIEKEEGQKEVKDDLNSQIKKQLAGVIEEITYLNDELLKNPDPSIKFRLTEKIKELEIEKEKMFKRLNELDSLKEK